MKYLVGMIVSISILWGGRLSNEEPKFTKREIHSLKLAKKWISNKHRSSRGRNGSIVFLHGATLPSVIAAPLRITDIQLQAGEKIREIQIGDKVRWNITPSISGTAPNEISHVIVKPIDVGLKTTLAIFTDRRTYHINLVSSNSRYMPIVSFKYEDEINKKWATYQRYIKGQQRSKEFSVDGSSKVRNIDKLDFSYYIDGDYYWKPVRVYNDGVKTYIQMPERMKFRESPALMVLDNTGKKLVNYRLKGDRYIVDKLFHQAVLIMGIGPSQEKVIITHSGKHSSSKRRNALRIFNESDNRW